MILQLCEYNSFYNFIYVTKTFQLAIDGKLIYSVCLKTTYESLRVLEKNHILSIELHCSYEYPMNESLRKTAFYEQANHPRHRLVTKEDACFNDTIMYRNLL